MESLHTLSEFAEIVNDNFQTIRKNFPRTAAAGEAVQQAFTSLLQTHIAPSGESHHSLVRTLLLWGVHSAWIDCSIAASAGHTASAYSNLRRAIEFTCYGAKVKNSDTRALDWANQRTDENARRRFASECAIPHTYDSEKYRFLWSLIVAHESSNYYGSHGDFEALSYSLKSFSEKIAEKKIVFNYQAEVLDSLRLFEYMVLHGKRILIAFREIMDDLIIEPQPLDQLLNYARDSVNDAISELSKLDRPGWFPQINPNDDHNDDRFKEIVAAAKARRKS